ncbi:MAG: hypothetical protein K6F79_09065 [Saccharofermentans sp.]|nr:hypothetical protein [Saccharofermentans sp.]
MFMKDTGELDKKLLNTAPDKIGEYLKENDKYLAGGDKSFYYYFKDIVDAKNMRLKDIYTAAGVSESYGSKIVTMEKHTKNRDLIIKLCVVAHFALGEINTALKLYGFNALYSKNRKDACIIVAINNRIFELTKINEMLAQQGLEGLCEKGD